MIKSHDFIRNRTCLTPFIWIEVQKLSGNRLNLLRNMFNVASCDLKTCETDRAPRGFQKTTS